MFTEFIYTIPVRHIKIVKNTISTAKNVNSDNSEQNYSQEIYEAQKALKELGLYTSVLDGINGPGTKRALRTFQSKSGLNVYEYNYIWSKKRYRGVMAQELLKVNPDAVSKSLGFYSVDYDKIDVKFERVNG